MSHKTTVFEVNCIKLTEARLMILLTEMYLGILVSGNVGFMGDDVCYLCCS